MLHLLPSIALAQHAEWAGDLRAPVVVVREVLPDGHWGVRGFPKAEVEYIRPMKSSRLTLKAEHEAELGFGVGEDEHESKLEAELRRVPSHRADAWQIFVRTAALAEGNLGTSIDEVNALELAAGVRRSLESARYSGSIELRMAHRDRHDGRPDFDRFAVKLKYRRPIDRVWRLDAEMTLNGTQPTEGAFRSSGNLRLFALRSFVTHRAWHAGIMLYMDGAVEPEEAFRFGVGPALAAFW